MTALGFVGLGAMGSRIAGRLLEGNRLYGTNRTAAKADELVARGMTWCDTPRRVAAGAEVIFSMVTDDAALHAVMHGPDGILAGLTPGKLCIDMSTVGPVTARDLAQQIRGHGCDLMNAPVSGTVTAAADGTLTVMVGGTDDAFRAAEPLLRRLGRSVTHVGSNEQALLLKLAININLAAQMLAFSEGVLLAERGGVDPTVATTVMTTSAIGSPMLRARAALMLDLPEQAWFDIAAMHKDIGLALAAARDLDVGLASAAATVGPLTRAESLGYAHRDIAALYQALGADRRAT